MVDTGILLCGSDIAWETDFLADIIGLGNLGGERRAIDNAKNSDAGDWAGVIYSCIRRGLPFTCTIVFSPNQNWKTALGAAAATWTITWPQEAGYTNSATLAWTVGMTRYVITGSLEERVMAEVTLTPSKAPTLTPAAS